MSATSAAASKKMINAAESKKNTKPLSLAMSSDEDLLLLRALFLGFYVIKINDLNLTLNLCFSMFIIRTHPHTLSMSQESSYHIHLPCNSTSYNSAQLCSSSVHLFHAGSSKHIPSTPLFSRLCNDLA